MVTTTIKVDLTPMCGDRMQGGCGDFLCLHEEDSLFVILTRVHQEGDKQCERSEYTGVTIGEHRVSEHKVVTA